MGDFLLSVGASSSLSGWGREYAIWEKGYSEGEGEGLGAQKEEGDECEELHANDKVMLKNGVFLGLAVPFHEFWLFL